MKEFQRKAMQDFASELVSTLKQKAPKASGKLKNSFKADVSDDKIDIKSVAYALMIDKGVNGKKKNWGSSFSYASKRPPLSAMEDMSKRTGIPEFVLSNSIFENGIRPKFFMTKTVEGEVGDFGSELAVAVWNDSISEMAKSGDENTKIKLTK